MASQSQPDDPFTTLTGAAVQMHEMYVGFCEAGFPEARAYALTRTVLVEGMRVNNPCPHCGRTREGGD